MENNKLYNRKENNHLKRVRSVVRISRRSSEPQTVGSKPIGPVTIMALLNGFYQYMGYKKKVVEYNNQEQDTWSLYLYAMKSPVTREKYQKRLERFFDSLGLEGKTIEEKSRVFVNIAKKEGNG